MMSMKTTALRRRDTANPIHPDAEYILGGTSKSVRFADSVRIPFEDCAPVRAFRSWPGKRNYSGAYWSSTTQSHIGFESLFERTALMTLDRDPSVVAISSQPMWIHWSDSGRVRSHAPDYFARHDGGDGEIIDVRPAGLVDSAAEEVFDFTRRLCEQAGFRYRVMSDLGRELDANLRFIAPYHDDRWKPQRFDRESLFGNAPELSLDALAASVEAGAGLPFGFGRVYWLIWHAQIDVDLTRPLSSLTKARPVTRAER